MTAVIASWVASNRLGPLPTLATIIYLGFTSKHPRFVEAGHCFIPDGTRLSNDAIQLKSFFSGVINVTESVTAGMMLVGRKAPGPR